MLKRLWRWLWPSDQKDYEEYRERLDEAMIQSHRWRPWTVVTSTTPFLMGKQQRVCSVCRVTQETSLYSPAVMCKESESGMDG